MAISYDISILIYSYWREHLGYNSRSYRRYFSLPTKISYISRLNNLMPFSNHHNTQITTLYIIEYNPQRMYMYVQRRNSGLQSVGVPWSPMESRGVPRSPMESRGVPRSPMESRGVPRSPMESLESRGVPWNPMESRGVPKSWSPLSPPCVCVILHIFVFCEIWPFAIKYCD
jgi:hypothetical protein